MSADPRDAVRRYLAALESGDAALLADAVTSDIVAHAPDGSVALRGREEWVAAQLDGPFAEERISVEDAICEADRVAVRYRLSCVHAPDGRPVETSGTKIYRVEAGRVAEIWGHDDVLGVLRQLGRTTIP